MHPITLMALPTLPPTPCASTKHGMWYVFHDGADVIRAWGSHWMGLERIYFNNTLLKQWGHLKKRDEYSFCVKGREYRIQCVKRPDSRWQVECLLWRNETIIDGWTCRRRRLLNMSPTIAYLYAGIFMGMIGGLFQLPAWHGISFIFVMIVITLIAAAKTDSFVFEKHNLRQGLLTPARGE